MEQDAQNTHNLKYNVIREHGKQDDHTLGSRSRWRADMKECRSSWGEDVGPQSVHQRQRC